MRVFRLSRQKYGSVLSGKGAALSGSRWNSKGVEIIYTSESRALAMAEVMVHLSLATLPSDFIMLEIDVPDSFPIQKINLKQLPENWNSFPYPQRTQNFGDAFIRENKDLILQAPSAVVQGDFNYLLNPFHKSFKLIKMVSTSNFPVDVRIFK